jgi:predicted metal-dependent enzyme (double-stranded beta helix superfamily)
MSTATVAGFMEEARSLLAGGVSDAGLQAVGRRLAELGRAAGFVAYAEMKALHASDSTFRILQSDPDGLTLMLASFSAAEETPVHDHSSWGVACVIRGVDSYRHWTMSDGRVRVLYQKQLRPGDFVTWLDPPHDIHSQQGVGEAALELVLFGKDVTAIPRNYYDPETGSVRSALPR